MRDVTDRVRDVLAANAPLSALLTGGVFTDYAVATGKHPVGPDEQPAAYTVDAAGIPVLKPFALVTESTATRPADAPCDIDTFLTIWFYQADGYDSIRAAEPLAIGLLDRQAFVTDGGVHFGIDWLDSPFRGAEDPSLITGTDRRASMEQLRFMVRQDL